MENRWADRVSPVQYSPRTQSSLRMFVVFLLCVEDRSKSPAVLASIWAKKN